MADRLVTVFGGAIQDLPQAHAFALVGLDFAFGPAYNIILVDETEGKQKSEMINALRNNYLPNIAVLFKNPDPKGVGYQEINQKQTAYVCIGQTCMPPTNDSKEMLKLLEKREGED